MRIYKWCFSLLNAAAGVVICCNVGLAQYAPAGQYPPPSYHNASYGYLADEEGEEKEEEESEIEKKFKELDEKYDKLADDHKALKDSLKNYAQTGGSGSTSMKVNGRIHMDMWTFPDTSEEINDIETGNPNIPVQDRIGFRRLRMGVKGKLPYNMEYKMELEFAGGNDVEFRDAYFGWNELPCFQTVLVGNQKRPYGLDHLNSSRYNVFIERPFVIECFNQDARRFGVCAYGVSEDEAWNWRYGYYNQRLIQDEGNYIGNHWQGQVAGRLANTIWYDESSDGRGYAHWAISGTWADTDRNGEGAPGSADSEADFRTRPEARTRNRWLDTGEIAGGEDYFLLGGEGLINVGPLQICGEYQNVWLNRAGAPDLHFHGGYCYASYFLTGEHIPWERDSGTLGRVKPFENFFWVDAIDGCGVGTGAWQVAARFSYLDLIDDNIFGGEGTSVTAGVNWYWTPYARMQFNYIYGWIDDSQVNGGGINPADLNSGEYQIVGLRWMIDY